MEAGATVQVSAAPRLEMAEAPKEAAAMTPRSARAYRLRGCLGPSAPDARGLWMKSRRTQPRTPAWCVPASGNENADNRQLCP
jgi:hypothetical protein